MRAAFLGRLPVPQTVRASRRRWAGPAVRGGRVVVERYTGAFEALRVLGCAATGLCEARVLGPLPDHPEPPMVLWRAGPARHAVVLDHNSLYALVAIDILRGRVPDVYPADPNLARDVAARVENLLGYKYDVDAERYIVVSEPTSYYRFRATGPSEMSSRPCRRWYEDHARDQPLRFEEVPEVLRGVPCRGWAVRVKDVAKFSILAAIGYTKRTTGLWRYVVAWARRVVMESVRWLREQGIETRRVYVDSYEVEEPPGREPPLWRRYAVKVEAEGPAVTILPPLYRVGERVGLWAVWEEDGPVRDVVAARGVATVWYQPSEEEWYRRGHAVMRCEAEPSPRVLETVSRTAERYAVRVSWRGCWRVEDLAPGRAREWREDARRVVPLAKRI